MPLSLIDPDPGNPRGSDGEEDLPELIDSVRTHGVLQPILVRPTDGRFKIVAGERRFRASSAVGTEAIPAIVREMSDEEAEEIQLIENAQRKDPNPLLLAGRIQRLIDRLRTEGHDRPNEVAAQKLGKPRTWISNVLFAGKCKSDVQDLITKGIVRDLGRIRELESLRGKRREEAVALALRQGKVTKEILRPPRPSRPRVERPKPDIREAEQPDSLGVEAGTDAEPAEITPTVFMLPGRESAIRFIRASGVAGTTDVDWAGTSDNEITVWLRRADEWLCRPAND